MKIDLKFYVPGKDGKEGEFVTKTYTTPFVSMLARRKYLEMEVDKGFDMNNLKPEQMDEVYSLLPNIVFHNQFTLEDLYKGADQTYIFEKLFEMLYGINPEEQRKLAKQNTEEAVEDPNSLKNSEEKS
ncbi:phage tail assembly chaperone G [Evansella cellulosilytica]|uniref:Uncharacterized protein n=1 Tax=Evansella cellulosilytica (strain ATCC 21833 / DSM 2522 / FERM P-1141 / JCM 9156 / N-4) TaxID=649639 RepID=E6TVG1_EVAC2|nr:hypothetical protein [Evansella cellulosilytica]ADU30978.1 hypothetical protein Bcell_2723 [Evansella cellulosilytica DSM 2522]